MPNLRSISFISLDPYTSQVQPVTPLITNLLQASGLVGATLISLSEDNRKFAVCIWDEPPRELVGFPNMLRLAVSQELNAAIRNLDAEDDAFTGAVRDVILSDDTLSALSSNETLLQRLAQLLDLTALVRRQLIHHELIPDETTDDTAT